MGQDRADIFGGVDFGSLEIVAPTPATPETQTVKDPEPETVEPRQFKPASVNGGGLSDVSPIDPDEMFEMAETQFRKLSENKVGQSYTESKNIIQPIHDQKTLNTTDIMSPEMVEISAIMYVQVLETIWGAICEWFSGVSTDYNFEKKLKDRYEKITGMYFEAQNIRLTPTHFFILMTLFVLFAPAFKAYGDRKRRIKAESFKKKVDRKNDQRNTGEQGVLFDSEPVAKGRLYFAAEKYEDGTVWYTKDAISGAYAKKGDRQRVPPELESFVLDFKTNNREWPTKKQVDIFLTQP